MPRLFAQAGRGGGYRHTTTGSAVRAAASLEVARLFPQLEILAFIGKGGMGAVYQARPAHRLIGLLPLKSFHRRMEAAPASRNGSIAKPARWRN